VALEDSQSRRLEPLLPVQAQRLALLALALLALPVVLAALLVVCLVRSYRALLRLLLRCCQALSSLRWVSSLLATSKAVWLTLH